MSSALEPRAGATVTGLFLGSLAIAGAVALVTAPITPRMAAAQTVANANDQPTAVTLPDDIGTVNGRDRATGGVRAPSALSPSTEVMPSDGSARNSRVDPLDRLSPSYRRNSASN